MMIQTHPNNFTEVSKKWKLNYMDRTQKSTLAEAFNSQYYNRLGPYITREKNPNQLNR